MEKVWNNVYGKFDKAVLHLVVDVLCETKNAGGCIKERLSSALMRMEDTDSAVNAAKAIEKGKNLNSKILKMHLNIMLVSIKLCLPSALLTVDCLAVILEDVEDWFQLGVLLGIDEKVLNSIDDYYSGKESSSFVYNMISRWFREGPEEPIKLLIAGLKSLEKDEIATQLANLFSFGTILRFSNDQCTDRYFLSILCRPIMAQMGCHEYCRD